MARAATVVVAAIAPAVILAFAPWVERTGLDRFTAAKEMVVLVLAAIAAAAAVLEWRAVVARGVDAVLVGILGLTAVGAAAIAVDPGAAWRATAMTGAGITLFWLARTTRPQVIIMAVGVATAIGGLTVVLEAFGVVAWSLDGRGPGGSEGHRNFMAHSLALGLPAAIAATIGATRSRGRALGAIAIALVAAAITLSRSRTAWVAAAVGLVVLAAAALRATRPARLSPSGVRARRTTGVAVLALLGGIVAAIAIPNRLSWSSSSPYGDSAASIAEFTTGSGRGRILQYAATARMVVDRPWLGVGPAQWSNAYPAYSRQPDANYSPLGIEPVSRLANADWLPFAAERGLPAACLLLLAGMLVVAGCARALRGPPEARAPAVVALAALAVAAVAGTFDSVLTRPTPLVFLALLVGAGMAGATGGRVLAHAHSGGAGRTAAVAVIMMLGIAVIPRPAIALSAIYLHESKALEDRALAAERNPSAYEVNVVLALTYTKQQDCARAKQHARAALAVYPHHLLARRVIDRCGSMARSDTTDHR